MTLTQFSLSSVIRHNRISQLKIKTDIFFLDRIFIRRDLSCLLCKKTEWKQLWRIFIFSRHYKAGTCNWWIKNSCNLNNLQPEKVLVFVIYEYLSWRQYSRKCSVLSHHTISICVVNWNVYNTLQIFEVQVLIFHLFQ